MGHTVQLVTLQYDVFEIPTYWGYYRIRKEISRLFMHYVWSQRDKN